MKQYPNMAKLIRRRREELGIFQDTLGLKIGYQNGQFISKIEKGNATVPNDQIKPVAKVLKMKLSTLVEAKAKDFRLNVVKEVKAT